MDQPHSMPFTVLLVEDNKEECISTNRMLEESKTIDPDLAELVVNKVDSYQAAINCLNEVKVDFILYDLAFPDVGGMENFYYLKTLKPEIPIVILSETYDSSSAVSALQAGAQDYLSRSEMDATSLARTIRNAVERNRLIVDVNNRKSQAEQAGKEKAELMFHFASDTQELVSSIYKLSTGTKAAFSDRDKDKLLHKAGLMIKSLSENMDFLKDYSDLELGSFTLNNAMLNLGEAVTEIIDEVAVFDDGMAFLLEDDLSDFTNYSAFFDLPRLKQIASCFYKTLLLFTTNGDVFNLKISSAKHESTFGGKIELTFALKIKDKELATAEQNLLLDSISLSDLSAFKKYGINGLELTIVSRIAKLMDGSVWVTSNQRSGTIIHWNVFGNGGLFT